MNGELAQLVTLILHGNAYLASPGDRAPELLHSHSTFQFVSAVTFRKQAFPGSLLGCSRVVAMGTGAWFMHLRKNGVRDLMFGLLEQPGELPAHIAAAFAGGGSWMIQTDRGKCWQPRWQVGDRSHPQRKIWEVTYTECAGLPVRRVIPDRKAARGRLEGLLMEAKTLSERNGLGWEGHFMEALNALGDPFPHLPHIPDLFPTSFVDPVSRQLLAGAAKAWVFGGMGSWNDLYIPDEARQREYERVTRELYDCVIQAIGAAVDSQVGVETG